MAIQNETFQSVLDAAKMLSSADQQRLIETLTKEIQAATSAKPLALRGRWKGITLTEAEITSARRECWKGLGK